ncbi:hypothetical protein LDENG_00190820, partial [Lucifuga dentata]
MADFSNSSEVKVDSSLDEDRQLAEAKKELETWKAKVEKADDVKARLILENLEEDEVKAKAKRDMCALIDQQEQCQKDFSESMKRMQEENLRLQRNRQNLMEKMKKIQAELQYKKAESTKFKQKFKVGVNI